MTKPILVTTEWAGGSPRITISRCDETAVIKLLGARNKRFTCRQQFTNLSDTVSLRTSEAPAENTEAILLAAPRLSRSAGNCWIWDSCDLGVADLYNATLG
jgi:hypothetical protein